MSTQKNVMGAWGKRHVHARKHDKTTLAYFVPATLGVVLAPKRFVLSFLEGGGIQKSAQHSK